MHGSKRMWEVSQLLLPDDATLVTNRRKGLQNPFTKFGTVSDKKKLMVKVTYSKVMRSNRERGNRAAEIVLNGEILE